MLSALLCLLFQANAIAQTDTDARLLKLEERIDILELRLRFFGEDPIIAPAIPRKIRTKEELAKDLQLDGTGESKRRDALQDFPEISTFVAWSSGDRHLVNGLGIELFHNRSRPRSHKFMFKLLLSDDWYGATVGFICVPVINFNVGPFIARDLQDKETVLGLQASVFSF